MNLDEMRVLLATLNRVTVSNTPPGNLRLLTGAVDFVTTKIAEAEQAQRTAAAAERKEQEGHHDGKD